MIFRMGDVINGLRSKQRKNNRSLNQEVEYRLLHEREAGEANPSRCSMNCASY
jgi:hypothetical protein